MGAGRSVSPWHDAQLLRTWQLAHPSIRSRACSPWRASQSWRWLGGMGRPPAPVPPATISAILESLARAWIGAIRSAFRWHRSQLSRA